MKVWSVRLSLSNDGRGNWLNFFDVDTDDKEYKLVNGSYCEVKTGWVRNEIPSEVTVRHIASGYLVECGYTEKPTEFDLGVIEFVMKQSLNDYIEHEYKQYTEMFNAKIKGLFSPTEEGSK